MNKPILSRIGDSLRVAWNVFRDRDPREENQYIAGSVYSTPQHRTRLMSGNDKSIVAAIYNRIATDCAMQDIRHVRVDDNDVFVEEMDSGLNECLTVAANIDQTSFAFKQDAVMSMFDEGHVCIVPTDTNVSLTNQNAFDVLTMRTGKIVAWYPSHVRVLLYNDITGIKTEITLPKSKVCIVENPFFSVMNERNSIGKRLIEKLNLLDVVDKASSSGKLDLIMQLPYSLKSETRTQQAEKRRKDLENQLKDSTYGIGYIDATEKVTQLNRPADNNLLEQVKYLTEILYGQLGMSPAILNNTADENEMLNYQTRVVAPIINAITAEIKRKFLTRTARSQKQSIKAFRDMFSMVTPERLAELSDKFIRGEIASPNDFRAVVGWRPSKDPKANELRNRNLNEAAPPDASTDSPIDVTKEFSKVKQ